jgi:ligand-binding sensor domain-containing protein
MRQLGVLIILAFFTITSFAQLTDIRFEHLSVEHGLSNSVVRDVLQDNQGFIWIATDDGLSKYDGYSFTIYRHNPLDSNPLVSSFVNVIFECSDSILWIGTDGGLQYFDFKYENFKKTNIEFSIRAIKELSDNEILVGGDGGLRILDKHKLNITSITTGEGLPSNQINDIFPVSENKVLIASSGCVIDLNIETKEVNILLKSVNQTFNCFSRDKYNNLWIGSTDGLYYYDNVNKTFRHIHNENNSFQLSGNEISDILCDDAGQVWICTIEGLNIYNYKEDAFQIIMADDTEYGLNSVCP